MDYYSLRYDAEHEPSVPEEAGKAFVIITVNEPQYNEAQYVKNGTEQTENDHEFFDPRNVPLFGHPYAIVLNMIERHAELREIVQDILNEYMYGEQRQERKEDTRYQHREHIPEVAADGHLEVFCHIRERAAPLYNAFVEDIEVFLEQYDIRYLLRDIDRSIDRDTDVGLL